jgi:nucleoside-diphosphate-sugar epimerase
MRVLFLGGTGTISTACTQLALQRGFELTLFNRAQRERSNAAAGAKQIVADLNDSGAAQAALAGQDWDVVVDFIAFSPAQVQQRIELFRGRVGQYIFISSASAYQKPVTHYLLTESTPLANPYWAYSRNKIACEELLLQALRDEQFPATIVRPSFTYGETTIPLALNSGSMPYTVVDRMRRGAPVIVPGDGTSLWQLTHNSDFAKGLIGLLGHQSATGHAFHITSDEVLDWNQIYRAVADAAGVTQPDLVHIASDFITACVPAETGGLHGDKSNSVVIDNTKIKRFVPDFVATTRFRDGVKRSIAWFDAEASRRKIDADANRRYDTLVATYRGGLQAAVAAFAASAT